MPALISWWTQDLRTLNPQAPDDQVAAIGADLLRRWTEPHRRYHSTRHLVEMFWALEDLTDAGELTSDDAALGRVAAWLHDAVYEPLAPSGANEAASAELARVVLPRVGLSPEAVETVVDLVEMTAAHTIRSSSALQQAFHDADLWILAASPERFDAYCAAVREEYASVPDEAYGAGRTVILRGLVGASGIYLTELGRRDWEPPARVNLARELDRLA